MNPALPDPLPRVGARVALRRLVATDLAAFQAYRNDETVGRYQGWSAQTDAQALAFIEGMSGTALFPRGAWLQMAVADREANTLMGDIGICMAADERCAELGFTLSPRFQGNGFATEAVREALALVFEHSGAPRVVCVTDARNNRSIRLLERVGMRRVASAEAVFRGEACVEHIYTFSRADRR